MASAAVPATMGSMAGMGRSPYGIGGRAPIGSTGSLAAHNPYSGGARPGIGGGAGLGGRAGWARRRLGAGGRAPIGMASHTGGLGGGWRRAIGSRDR